MSKHSQESFTPLNRPEAELDYVVNKMLASLQSSHVAVTAGTGYDPEKYSSLYSEAAHLIRRLRELAPSSESTSTTETERLKKALRDIAQYTGHGPATTPWQDIVRTMGDTARAALEGLPPSTSSAGIACKPTIFGLMNKHGVFHMSESCIAFDDGDLDAELEHLVDSDEQAGWKIVALYAEPVVSSATGASIQAAYCAANDYINAMLNTTLSEEKKAEFAETYWQRVREVR